MQRAVIYCRCSTEEENQKEALAQQVKEAKECVKRKGWMLVDSYIESRSGTSTKGRNEYNRLYEDLSENQFEIIVIKSQDRLMRNVKDWYLFVDKMTGCKKQLFMYIDDKFYSEDDGLLCGIKAILAEDYSRELSKKSNNAHRQRQSKNGPPLLTSNVFGYKKLPDKSIEIIEEEAEIKRQMYELCAAGYGSRTIAAILKDKGIVNRRGRAFNDGDIRRIIRSPLNKGMVVMNRFHYDFATKKTLKVPEEEQFVYENKVPAIVSEELWEQANQQIDNRAGTGHKDNCYPYGINPGKSGLSGKLFCGLCGKPYYRTVRRGYGDKTRKIHEWKCRTYLEAGRNTPKDARQAVRKVPLENAHGCDNVHLEEELFLQILHKAFGNQCQVDTVRIVHDIMDMLRAVLAEKDYSGDMERGTKKLCRIKQQMNLLADKLLDGVLPDRMYQEKQKELEIKLKKIENNIQTLKKQNIQGDEVKKRLEKIQIFLSEGNGIRNASLAYLLDEVEKIVIYPAYMEIFLNTAGVLYVNSVGNPEKALSECIRIEYGSSFNYLEKKKEEREIIVAMMQENPLITAKQIAKELNITFSGVQYKISILKKEGRIRFNGAGGRGRWEILKK